MVGKKARPAHGGRPGGHKPSTPQKPTVGRHPRSC